MQYLYGAALAAALFFSAPSLHARPLAPPAKIQLQAVSQQGEVLAVVPLGARDEWCLLWNHSVTGFTVSDCFVNADTNMFLHSSHQPDFAAGLGYLEGRGTLESDGLGGYLITQIDEPVPGNTLPLRVGSKAVNHRILHDGEVTSLSELAAGQRITLQLMPISLD